MFDLDWNMIVQSRGLLMTGMWLTLQVTLVAILAGLGFGIVLAAMSTVKVPVLNWLAKMYVSLFRSIPLVMLLLWFFLIVPQVLKSVLNISPSVDIRLISAMVAFSLLEAAFFCEIIRAGIQSLPAGQSNAARALGMSWAQSMWLIILPQALRKMLPVTLTQCIVIFQDTSLVYVIALGDFFSRAKSVGERDGTLIQMLLFAGLTYWVICSLATMIVKFVQGRVKYD